ncbi:hypothetical protein NKR23_g10309 [Pleurostoma richardsiae]|uniref:Uncharacterized protein n=1 Tax=Pleurostoma richardsiae TaxID=41990 RepID=A0AA38VIS6_9PEZI|nr:hypothetical protein NKR23_g10309 [Pleurostoma richardsiae]
MDKRFSALMARLKRKNVKDKEQNNTERDSGDSSQPGSSTAEPANPCSSDFLHEATSQASTSNIDPSATMQEPVASAPSSMEHLLEELSAIKARLGNLSEGVKKHGEGLDELKEELDATVKEHDETQLANMEQLHDSVAQCIILYESQQRLLRIYKDVKSLAASKLEEAKEETELFKRANIGTANLMEFLFYFYCRTNSLAHPLLKKEAELATQHGDGEATVVMTQAETDLMDSDPEFVLRLFLHLIREKPVPDDFIAGGKDQDRDITRMRYHFRYPKSCACHYLCEKRTKLWSWKPKSVSPAAAFMIHSGASSNAAPTTILPWKALFTTPGSVRTGMRALSNVPNYSHCFDGRWFDD